MIRKENTMRKTLNNGLFCVAAILLAGTVAAAAPSNIIKIDGSSTVFPISEAAAEEFQASNRDVRVVIGVSGTGGGFKRFAAGETDISNASRRITEKEAHLCRSNGIDFVELAVAYDGLAVVVNSENDWVDHLTTEELKKIWQPDAQGVITKWSQVRRGFPNAPISLFGPGTDSGTFDYFSETVCGKSGASRGDYTASEDDNVLVRGIAAEKNALGYFGFAYYEQNADSLKIVPVLDSADPNMIEPVAPSQLTVKNGTYKPLSRPLFIYVSRNSLARPEIRTFVNFYIKHAGELAEEVGYTPLPDDMYKQAHAAIVKAANAVEPGKRPTH